MTRTALVVRGGWDGHEPVETTEMFIPFLEDNGFEVRVVEVASGEAPTVYADADYLASLDLIVQTNTMNTAEREQIANLRAAIAGGTGFAGWHGGIADSYRNQSDYLQLIGAQFAAHASNEPSTLVGEQSDNYRQHSYQITELGRSHPITEGIDDFELTTEQYWVLSDGYLDVLATTTQSVLPWGQWNREIVFPAIWTRQWGEGRMFVSTPGHHVDILEHTSVNTIVKRGLLWAARGENEE